ncbi:MAG: hypothetical protein A3F54_00260 [Candidatus Kerfeldbacteria bacterium RIFCSPHIGHO2_12_FULL_48_17]|uniref:ROK family protein n=1 Tax=Candidatus Kerfeldbacteria bacterium RIFCSPHIGHO2_12_FULL_48_17 TaxID=1798542 RepID=A0A1G2B1T4_9BACT|nr:MAG: hypothetical protein A3F54_00260 [Candidatus Kerfeldbacteria bacterium RIFCSPHIGHO2_12_FULL_48_17]
MYILYDIGGTNMRLAALKDLQTFGEAVHIKTPQNFDEAMKQFSQTALKLADGEKIFGVAGGVPGALNHDKNSLYHSPNLTGWDGKPFQKVLSHALGGAKIFMENDTDMIGLGEAAFGAGKGRNIVVYMTVSTGVGGSRIVNGKIDPAFWGQEPGQQIIDPSDRLYDPGTLENYVSGGGVERIYGKPAYEITDAAVWDELAKWLAYGLHNSIVHWSPEIIILGGSMMTKQPGISLDAVRGHLRKIMKIFPELPELTLVGLGDEGGFYGSMQYLQVKRDAGEIA